MSAATRFRYFEARWAGVNLVCILIASELRRGAERLAVSPKSSALSGPTVKQPWIVRELQQRRSNFLRFRHSFVREIKAGFLECTSGIGHVSQPTDRSIAHTKPHLVDIQDISITRLRGASEGRDAAQIGFRAILSIEEV